MNNVFNFSRRKVGGIWFVKLGRFTLSFSVSKCASPIGCGARRKRKPRAKNDMFSGPYWEALADEAARLRAAIEVTSDC